MPRVCQRPGCGRQVRDPGNRFCCAEHRWADHNDQLRQKRDEGIDLDRAKRVLRRHGYDADKLHLLKRKRGRPPKGQQED